MKDMIEWLEEKVDEYKRDAEYAQDRFMNTTFTNELDDARNVTRYAVYTSVWRDLERKLWEVKALQECQITT